MDALCLARIESNWGGGREREYISPMSEEKEENIPQSKQGKSILPASISSICIVCFLFLFPSSLFPLRKESESDKLSKD